MTGSVNDNNMYVCMYRMINAGPMTSFFSHQNAAAELRITAAALPGVDWLFIPALAHHPHLPIITNLPHIVPYLNFSTNSFDYCSTVNTVRNKVK